MPSLRATVPPPRCLMCKGPASPPSRMGWLESPETPGGARGLAVRAQTAPTRKWKNASSTRSTPSAPRRSIHQRRLWRLLRLRSPLPPRLLLRLRRRPRSKWRLGPHLSGQSHATSITAKSSLTGPTPAGRTSSASPDRQRAQYSPRELPRTTKSFHVLVANDAQRLQLHLLSGPISPKVNRDRISSTTAVPCSGPQ
jgi:hypothetical protein